MLNEPAVDVCPRNPKVPKASSLTSSNIVAAFVPSQKHPHGDRYQQARIEEFGIHQNDVLKSLGAVVSAPIMPKQKCPRRGRRRHPTTASAKRTLPIAA